MFRSGRTRPAHARSSGSETLLRIRSLAGYIIGTLESRFRKRQGNRFPLADQEAVSCDAECRVMMKDFHLTSGLCITNRTA